MIDLIGQRFGRLIVINRAKDYIQPSGQHKQMWHCKCDCGNECDVRMTDLKSGNTKSCGCLQQEARGQSTFEDLTGKKFGRLKVICRISDHITPSGQRQRMWKCLCDCGKECNVYATQLKRGKDSCGCILEEKKKTREIEKNNLKELKKKIRKEQIEQNKKDRLNRLEKNKIKKKQEYLEKNSLATKFPELLSEWDYSKNSILPTEVKASSSEVVWWICSLNHSYDMRINSRTGNQKCGCPYCSIPAKRILKGFNDLETKYTSIALEWHPSKNGMLKPNDVLCGSGKKVWWLGKCGHEYEQKIVNRVKGASCPYCSHQKLLVGYNDLASTNPEILDEWDYEKNTVLPTQIGVGTHQKIWWKCPFGHSYQSYPSNRCGSSHSGCPICDKENHTSFPEQALYYYIKKIYPDAINSDKTLIGMELDIFIPSLKTAIEYDGARWHKNNVFEIKKNKACKKNGISLIRIREKGLELYDDCICIIRDDTKNNNSLSLAISRTLSLLNKNNDISIDVDRDSSQIYSLYVNNRKEQSLKNVFPEIAKEWHPSKNGELKSDMVAPMTDKKVWWLGKCGHEWQMSVQDRTNQNCGCPICSSKRIISGINDLLSKYPKVCEEWFYDKNNSIGLYPNSVAPHSDKKAWWKCKSCGNVWQAKIDHRTRLGVGCPKCGRKKVEQSRYKAVKCIETGIVYKSIIDAEKNTGINRICISQCCKNKQKTAGKLHWKYEKDDK